MTASDRRAYIDWARGIAVLVMIEAHTTDAWTRAAVETHGRVSERGRARRLCGAVVSLSGRRRRRARGHAHKSSAPAAGRRRPTRCVVAGSRSSFSRSFSGCRRSSQPGQSSDHAVSRRHPQRDGAGDGCNRPGLGASSRHRRRASSRSRRSPARDRAGDADRARRGGVWIGFRSGSSGICARRVTTRRSRCSPGPVSCSPASRDRVARRASAVLSSERRVHAGASRCGRGARRFRILGGRASVDLSQRVILDELADLVRDPCRHSHDRARRCVLRRGADQPADSRNVRGEHSLSCLDVVRWQTPLARIGRARCSSIGFTSSSYTGTRAGCGVDACRSGARASPSSRSRR